MLVLVRIRYSVVPLHKGEEEADHLQDDDTKSRSMDPVCTILALQADR